jgi:flagellum-specific ATP synthase
LAGIATTAIADYSRENSGIMHHYLNAVSPLDDLQAMVARARASRPAHRISGVVCKMTPSYLVVSGLSKFVSIGDAVAVAANGTEALAEVASIDIDTINITLVTSGAKVELGAAVTVLTGPLKLAPHISWKGRVLNALGEPIDDGPALQPGDEAVRIDGASPAPLRRQRLGGYMPTGVAAIDLLTPICAGQRIGIFAGSGVGKSTLLAMLSRAPSFDVTVLALVGERGREVRDFLEDTLGENREHVIAIVSTADETPMMRRLAPNSAMCIAEYFRKQGQNVLLIVDSVTRYAHAMRELALASQEPPVARGYPPSVFSALSRFLERAGTGEEPSGTITAVLSVLVDGDDHNDPIADATRGILDGHVVLDRAIAAQGRFPAVDPLASISRLAPKLRAPNQAQFVSQIIELIARYEETRDLRAIGSYRAGSDPTLDRALEIVPRLYDALKQGGGDPPIGEVYDYVARRLNGAKA